MDLFGLEDPDHCTANAYFGCSRSSMYIKNEYYEKRCTFPDLCICVCLLK